MDTIDSTGCLRRSPNCLNFVRLLRRRAATRPKFWRIFAWSGLIDQPTRVFPYLLSMLNQNVLNLEPKSCMISKTIFFSCSIFQNVLNLGPKSRISKILTIAISGQTELRIKTTLLGLIGQLALDPSITDSGVAVSPFLADITVLVNLAKIFLGRKIRMNRWWILQSFPQTIILMHGTSYMATVPNTTSTHIWELPGNYPVFTMVMVVYRYVERIGEFQLLPNFL